MLFLIKYIQLIFFYFFIKKLMNSCFLEIKRKIQILVITLNLVSFIIITSIIAKKKEYLLLIIVRHKIYIFIQSLNL